jgi:hypothetical protein
MAVDGVHEQTVQVLDCRVATKAWRERDEEAPYGGPEGQELHRAIPFQRERRPKCKLPSRGRLSPRPRPPTHCLPDNAMRQLETASRVHFRRPRNKTTAEKCNLTLRYPHPLLRQASRTMVEQCRCPHEEQPSGNTQYRNKAIARPQAQP